MSADVSAFQIEVEDTRGLCPAGERYASEQLRAGSIPVLCCEGPCIRGEIARQAAHQIGKQAPFARACQGEAVAVPNSGMARWVREAEKVVVLDGCFLKCQARMMRRLLRPGQLVEIDALPFYRKYVDLFEIDSVPEAERLTAADEVARGVLAQLADIVNARESAITV
ncbi:MAG TPA: putative zinc-binding protein [Longimicrobiales bacterium]|nr:putative zinc-binding protein [Longimicrobiales bacterium]